MTNIEIRNLRTALNFSQIEFGQLFGVGYQTVLNWENGRTEPSAYQLGIMMELRKKVEGLYVTDASKNIRNVLIAGGVIAFLYWLFQRE